MVLPSKDSNQTFCLFLSTSGLSWATLQKNCFWTKRETYVHLLRDQHFSPWSSTIFKRKTLPADIYLHGINIIKAHNYLSLSLFFAISESLAYDAHFPTLPFHKRLYSVVRANSQLKGLTCFFSTDLFNPNNHQPSFSLSNVVNHPQLGFTVGRCKMTIKEPQIVGSWDGFKMSLSSLVN
jgi:hypothetical protein